MGTQENRRARKATVCTAFVISTAGLLAPEPLTAQPAVLQAPVMQTGSAEFTADPAVSIIRTRLSQRLSGLPKIDDISPTGMPGLYEVRLGTDLFYSDAQGNYLIRGELIETQGQRNLTRERVAKLTAIDFDRLPLQDAIVWKSGTGQRRIAVFADPNCPYCKKFESELQGVKDVTVYTFLYPILAPDSTTKSEAIWCSTDPSRNWREWMLKGISPIEAKTCVTPIERNLALGKSHRVEGVPTLVFEDGARIPGFLPAEQMESRLNAVSNRPAQ